MSLTTTQLAVRGGRARQALLSPEQRTEMSVAAAKMASSKRCVCGHHASQHRKDRVCGFDVSDCAFIGCLCTEYRPRGDMLSQRELHRRATSHDPARPQSGQVQHLYQAATEPGPRLPIWAPARCRVKAHADRPLDPKRKNFCVDCAEKQRAQDVKSWRKRHGTVIA